MSAAEDEVPRTLLQSVSTMRKSSFSQRICAGVYPKEHSLDLQPFSSQRDAHFRPHDVQSAFQPMNVCQCLHP